MYQADNADVRNHVQVDRVLGLVDAHAFEGGRKIAGNTADGNNAEVNAWA